jgi:ribonucleoside-diphosphate reductase alpha chain
MEEQKDETEIENQHQGAQASPIRLSPQPEEASQPLRRRLPDQRTAVIHHFSVGGHEGYLIVGLYNSGEPGEIFIRMAKAGSTIAGLMDSFGIAVSLALQYRVPLKVLCDKFSHTRFEPSGWTTVKEIGYAKSLMDYIFRWMSLKFLAPTSPPETGARSSSDPAPTPAFFSGDGFGRGEADAPACKECGTIMSRNGSCYRCGNCGWTSGCS